MSPVFGCKLKNGSFDFAACRTDGLERLPVVGTHFQIFAQLHTNENANTVAQQNVEKQDVPPTLLWRAEKVKGKLRIFTFNAIRIQ